MAEERELAAPLMKVCCWHTATLHVARLIAIKRNLKVVVISFLCKILNTPDK
jgi:hypothetical protein